MHVTAKDFFFSIKKNPQKTKNTNEQYIMYTIYMDMPFLTRMSILFLLWTSDQQKHNLCRDNPLNIPTKFGSNWPSGLRED
jgi:hypothetical protein